MMKLILGCLATTILTFTAWPAGAVTLCPDETGAYTPDACDFILPIEPNPHAVECGFIAEWLWMTERKGNPVCMEYFAREAARDRLRYPAPPPWVFPESPLERHPPPVTTVPEMTRRL
jgi:hypothetical protein